MFKIKHITRRKLDAIIKKEPIKDSDFVEILKQPDTISDWRDKYKNQSADGTVSDDIRLHQEVEDAEAEEGYESEISNEDETLTKDAENVVNPEQLRDDKVRSLMKDYLQTEQGLNGNPPLPFAHKTYLHRFFDTDFVLDNDEMDLSGDDDDYELLDDN